MSDNVPVDQYSQRLLQLQAEVDRTMRFHRIRACDYAQRLLGSPGARFRGIREYCNLVRTSKILTHNILIDRRGPNGRIIPARPVRGNYSLWHEASR